MSGGSFDYFYTRGANDVARAASDLHGMAEAVRRFAPESPIVLRLVALSELASSLEREIKAHEDLLQAVEWKCSGDWGEDRVLECEGSLPPPLSNERELLVADAFEKLSALRKQVDDFEKHLNLMAKARPR